MKLSWRQFCFLANFARRVEDVAGDHSEKEMACFLYSIGQDGLPFRNSLFAHFMKLVMRNWCLNFCPLCPFILSPLGTENVPAKLPHSVRSRILKIRFNLVKLSGQFSYLWTFTSDVKNDNRAHSKAATKNYFCTQVDLFAPSRQCSSLDPNGHLLLALSIGTKFIAEKTSSVYFQCWFARCELKGILEQEILYILLLLQKTRLGI